MIDLLLATVLVIVLVWLRYLGRVLDSLVQEFERLRKGSHAD